jgi:hypothetical protein
MNPLGVPIEGTGSRARIQIFCQKCIILGLNKSLYYSSFWTLKMSLWGAVVFATFQAAQVKTYGRNSLEFAAKLLSGPTCYLIGSLVKLWIPIGTFPLFQFRDSFLTLYKPHNMFAVHTNLLESGRGHFGAILESVKQWFESSLQ